MATDRTDDRPGHEAPAPLSRGAEPHRHPQPKREDDLDRHGAAAEGAHEPRRHDSADKHVSGHAIYADDMPLARDHCHLFIYPSPHARARIRTWNLAPVREAPGFLGLWTADDVPGANQTGPVVEDEPLFALSERDGGEVVSEGQPLFAVAAESAAAARHAAALAEITWEILDPILTIDDAMAAESFISPPYTMRRGEPETAIAEAPHRLEGRIEIGGQDHFYLEGQVADAQPGEDDDVHVVSSTQHPSETQAICAHVLGVPSHSVVVETRRLGGGFGGKETQANFLAASAALAARALCRPVRVRLDRDDDMKMTGKRHPFRIDYDVGYDGAGRILGIRFRQYANCGWSTDLSNAVIDRAMFHADNCYYLPAAEITSYRCRTNVTSMTAFRGFGGPQGMVGIERVVDEIAHMLGRDPLEVRRINYYEPPEGPGERVETPYYMRVEDCVIGEITDELVESSDYSARRTEIEHWNADSPVLKRGIALTPVRFGISFTTSFLNQAGALVHVYQDGSIMLNHGGVEMGQGVYTKVAQVAASAFNVDLERVKITATRTDKVPNTSATAASSGSDINGMAVQDACDRIKARLIEWAAENWSVGAEQIAFLPNRIRIGAEEMPFDAFVREAYLARIPLSSTGYYATPKIHWDRDRARGRPFYYFAYGAAVSEAVIDTLTGENRLLRVDILHDVGRSLNPAIDLGQVEGGFVQGVGWLTTEELWWNDQGNLKTHAPSTYKIPACSDRAPDMRIQLWRKGRNRELTIRRSKAVGEPPLMLGISAFQALSHAVAQAGDGRYPALDTPATPERILAAIERVRS